MVQSVVGHNGQQVTFCYLSELLGKKVYGPGGQLLGSVQDLIATMSGNYPEVEAFVLKSGSKRRVLPIGADDFIQLARAKRLQVSAAAETYEIGPQQFPVRDTLYDKQIVDINGAKVERVNDVHFFVYGDKKYLVHVDVGFTGLSRRLGFEGGVRSLARLFGRELKDEFISWKFVQPLSDKATSPVQVSLRQEQIKQLHAGELADIIEELDRDERVSLVKSIDAEDAADALEEADMAVQTAIIRDLEPEKAADIIEEMEPAAAADLMDTLPEKTQQSIMAEMEDDERSQIERLTSAEENTAASLMTVEYVACAADRHVADALRLIKQRADEIESIAYVYCLDDEERLIGVVSLRDLILAEPETALAEVMHRRLATLRPDQDREEVAEQMMKFRFSALPVVDEEGRVQGIVDFKSSFDELVRYYYRLAS